MREEIRQQHRRHREQIGRADAQPISVHMLGERLTSEAQNRRKNGSAAHSTTGVASTSSSQPAVSPIQSRTGSPTIGPMPRTRSGTDSAALTHMRRVKSTSSGFGASSASHHRLERHAADRTVARPVLAGFRDASGRSTCCPPGWGAVAAAASARIERRRVERRLQIRGRISIELGFAAATAEPILDALMHRLVLRLVHVDGHAADRIDLGSGGGAGGCGRDGRDRDVRSWTRR
jgi:hypothetical protein